MSVLKALQPKIPANRYGIVTESMLDGTYRVSIDGIIRRISSSIETPPARGAQVVVGIVSGRETIISIGSGAGLDIKEITIKG
jgi:membrane protein implicated in regulation of membrane protease activity